MNFFIDNFKEAKYYSLKTLEEMQAITVQYLLQMAELQRMETSPRQVKKSVAAKLAQVIRNKNVKLQDALLTPANTLIKDTLRNRCKFIKEGGKIKDRIIFNQENKDLPDNFIEIDPIDHYNSNVFLSDGERYKIRLQNEYQKYTRKNPFRSPSTTTLTYRSMFDGISELHDTNRYIHQRQTHQYRFDILI